MAASNTLRALSAPLGPLVAGLLLTYTSPRTAIAVLAAPVILAGRGPLLHAPVVGP